MNERQITTSDPRTLDEQLDDVRLHCDKIQRQLNELKNRCRELERAKPDKIEVISKALDRAIGRYESTFSGHSSHPSIMSEANKAVDMLRYRLEKELEK